MSPLCRVLLCGVCSVLLWCDVRCVGYKCSCVREVVVLWYGVGLYVVYFYVLCCEGGGGVGNSTFF